jgi:putative colanic acid biosynthesis glycosyltransferase
MTCPSLTLITITKDDPAGLARTLASASVWRSCPGVEQLVIYAGVKPDVAAEAALTLCQQDSTGIAAAFNEGLARARGDWVWFINGGDAIHEALDPAWLLTHLGTTKADLVTGALQFDGEGQPRVVAPLAYQWPLLACWLMHPSTLARRTRLLAVGGFDERWRIAMDYDLWFRFVDRATVVDVLSVPFARFNRSGVSESPATTGLARREAGRVVLTHGVRLLRDGCWLGFRILGRLAKAAGNQLGPLRANRSRP